MFPCSDQLSYLARPKVVILLWWFKKQLRIEVLVKMAEWDYPGLISSHKHPKTTTTHGTIASENDLKSSRTDFLQLMVWRKSHIEMGRRGRDEVWSSRTPTLPVAPHKWKGYHGCEGPPWRVRNLSFYLGFPDKVMCPEKRSPQPWLGGSVV